MRLNCALFPVICPNDPKMLPFLTYRKVQYFPVGLENANEVSIFLSLLFLFCIDICYKLIEVLKYCIQVYAVHRDTFGQTLI